MILYRIPKGNLQEYQYVGLKDFAFEAFDHVFFTNRATALTFSKEVVEVYPALV